MNTSPQVESIPNVKVQTTSSRDWDVEFISSPSFQTSAAEEILTEPYPNSPAERCEGSLKAPKGTPLYLVGLYRTPLLSLAQEQYLFRKMNYLKYCAHCHSQQIGSNCSSVNLLEERESLLQQALEVRNQIVRANLRLVVSIAKKLVDSVNSLENLLSEGTVPLIRSVEIFDFERGFHFSTYATWAIRNCLHRVCARNKKNGKLHRTGKKPSYFDQFTSTCSFRCFEQYHLQIQCTISELVTALNEREQQIVKQRFGLTQEGRPQRFREIAEDFQISTERVRQLLVRSLDQMREFAENHHIEIPEVFV